MPIKIQGLKELQVKVDGLDEQTINKLLTESAILVEEDAKDMCPESGNSYPGFGGTSLKESITHEIDGTTAAVGTNKEYAPYVHQGTGIYATGGSNAKKIPWTYTPDGGQTFYTTYGQMANPFLTAALTNNQAYIVELFENAVKDKI